MPHLTWSPPALRDVARLHAFLLTKNKDAAIRAAKAMRQSFKLLGTHPVAGRPAEALPHEFREWPINFGDSGYLALYRCDGQHVIILAVRHTKELDY